MCLLLENVGGSEKNRLIIANVQSDDLLPSRMHAAVFSSVSGLVDDALWDAHLCVSEALHKNGSMTLTLTLDNLEPC